MDGGYGCGCENCTYNDPCKKGRDILEAEREQERNEEWVRLLKEAEEMIKRGCCHDCILMMLDTWGFHEHCEKCK